MMEEAPPLPVGSASELQDHVYRLTQENRDLKDYADRVTKELRRYQAVRPTPPPTRPEDDLPLPPWATNMQMMSPLLFAYEERIAELEAVVERSVSLAEQSRVLTRENDGLRAELQDRTEQLRAAQLMAPLAVDASKEPAAAAQQHEDLQELYRLSVEQNEALAQQNQLLKVQIDRMQQSITSVQQQAREAQARAMESVREAQTRAGECVREAQVRAMESAQVLSAEQERTEALESQRNVAEKRLTEVTAELVEEVRLREQLQSTNEGLQHEVRLQRHSNEVSKKSFDEHCALSAEEEERLKLEVSRIALSEKEMRQRITDLERELARAGEELFKARSDADATRIEAERMVKLMESMERRIKYISERHDQVTVKLSEEEHQVGELLTDKDRWSTSEMAAKKQAERLQASLDDEVERLKQDRNLEVENLQCSYKKQVTELEERLRRSEQSVSEFQSKVELVAKQRTWEASALERQSSVHAAEKTRLQDDLSEAQQTRLRLERQVDQTQQQVTQLRADLDAVTAKAREQANKASSDLALCRSKLEGSERHAVQTREEVRTVESRATNVAAEHARMQSELAEVRSSSAEAADAERRKAFLDRQKLERQLHSVTARARHDEQKAMELVQAQQALRIKWQNELGQEKDALEAQIERLVAENRAIRENGRKALRSLAAQRLASVRTENEDR